MAEFSDTLFYIFIMISGAFLTSAILSSKNLDVEGSIFSHGSGINQLKENRVRKRKIETSRHRK